MAKELNDLYKRNQELLELEKDYPPTIQNEIESLENVEAVLAIEKILRLEKEFPGIIKVRMLDHLEILADSARKGKYPLNNWLLPDGKKADRRTNYGSIQRHIDQENQGVLADHESGRPPRLHAACRLMMDHTRQEEGIHHPDDYVYGTKTISYKGDGCNVPWQEGDKL